MKQRANALICLSIATNLVCVLPALADTDSELWQFQGLNRHIQTEPIVIAQASTSKEKDPTAEKSRSQEKVSPEKRAEEEESSLLRDIQSPATRINALGIIAETLGLAAGLMLLTGAILAFFVKKFGLVKFMIPTGVVSLVLGLAAPGMMLLYESLEIATSLTIFFLLVYLAVFFLPTYLAFKDNAGKKVMITIINFAGFVVPGAGLIALYMVLKDKPAVNDAVG